MINSIKTSAWISFKNLRFSILQYFMLVVIFPCSYLVISLASGLGTTLENYILGLFCSMLFSVFLNVQSVMIANSNDISVIEQYATFKVRAIYVHLGNSLFHCILSLPFLAVMIVIGLVSGAGVYVLTIFPVWILSVLFMSFLSIVLGGIIKNPNIATPLLSMIYMIIVMITPFYANLGQISGVTRILYCINPFSHCLSLYAGSMGLPMLCAPVISVIILAILTLALGILSFRRWYDNKAIESLAVF